MKKTVWQIDYEGFLISAVELSENQGDFKENQWLIPAGCIEKKPPNVKEGFFCKWNGESWEYEVMPEPESVVENKFFEPDPEEIKQSKLRMLLDDYKIAELTDDSDEMKRIQEEMKEIKRTPSNEVL